MTDLPGTQFVRLVDVSVLGPVMVWAGTKLVRRYEALGVLLATSGLSTVVFNGVNYVRNRAKPV